ncbi:MAG TPA: DUF1326 domain-containing protein [Hyphomicrobium sp.]|nr:DUF1326 domain-containing protein [Hyphomicrobium sp.]
MNRRELMGTGLISFAMAASAGKIGAAGAETPAVTLIGLSQGWSLKGTYFEACSCETVCPCIFQSPPSHGDCAVLYAWQINDGVFGATSLSGLNVALAAYAGGHMQKVKWLAALYIDERANAEQRHALETIYTGKAGGFPAALVSFFEKFSGVKYVPIDYRLEGKNRAVDIPGILEAKIHAIKGQNDGDTVVSGHPLGLAPGNPLIVATSDKVRLTDYEWNWSFSGRAGGYSPFQYQSA